MNIRDHKESDGKMIWLSTSGDPSEVEILLDHFDETERTLAFALGARCGLRSAEILDVAPEDVVDTDAGTMLRVWDGKGGKYRETPVPDQLAMQIRTLAEYRAESDDEPVVSSISTTRSLRRWLEDARDELAEEYDDPGWRYLSTHDLRRTWATALSDADVDAIHALDWGGWVDIETFLAHYKGAYSPEAKRRERAKVDWL